VNLIDRALSRRLIGPKAEQLGPVAKPIARYVVVSDFDDQLRLQRLPFAAALRAPAAGPARRLQEFPTTPREFVWTEEQKKWHEELKRAIKEAEGQENDADEE
jgi:hypothetical protein